MHFKYYLVAVFFLFTLQLHAQIDSEAYKNELKRNDELKRREKLLKDSLKILKSTLDKVENNYNQWIELIKGQETDLNRSSNEERETEIANTRLRINRLEQDIQEEKEKLKMYNLQLEKLNDEILVINQKKDTLDKIKNNLANVLLSAHQPYLERPYSEMNLEELDQILNNCKQYTIDAKVNAFVAKAEQIKKNKRIYDEMIEVLSTPFNKMNIDRALSSSAGIIGGNALQQNEINEAKKQLNLYPEGLAAFKDFIVELNERRKDVNNYSIDFFSDDLPGILSKNNLDKRINDYLLKIPYLKAKYEEFRAQLNANPNNHSEIETEILNLYTN